MWILYLLITILVILFFALGSYQYYFKHPPMVRTIRKLERDIKGNKATKPISVKSRDKIIKKHLQDKQKLMLLLQRFI